MPDYAKLCEPHGLKPDCRCSCGSNVFAPSPIMFLHPDGRSLSSNQEGTSNCSIYVITCSCGLRYVMSATPWEHGCFLLPFGSEAAKQYLAPHIPDFDAPMAPVEARKDG